MRKIIIENGLDDVLFGKTGDALAKTFDADPSEQGKKHHYLRHREKPDVLRFLSHNHADDYDSGYRMAA